MWIKIIIIGLCSYLIGSIPFAFIIVKAVKKQDLRKIGSGNVGATNAMRVLGWKLGLLVLALDFVKGLLPVALVTYLFSDLIPFAQAPNFIKIFSGIAAICGHVWTIFLSFKGGKGVATSAGVFSFLLPIPFLIALSIFIIVVSIFKYISLGSMTAAVSVPLTTFYFTEYWDLRGVTIILAALIIITHHSNIKRLVKGNEKRFSFRKSGEERV